MEGRCRLLSPRFDLAARTPTPLPPAVLPPRRSRTSRLTPRASAPARRSWGECGARPRPSATRWSSGASPRTERPSPHGSTSAPCACLWRAYCATACRRRCERAAVTRRQRRPQATGQPGMQSTWLGLAGPGICGGPAAASLPNPAPLRPRPSAAVPVGAAAAQPQAHGAAAQGAGGYVPGGWQPPLQHRGGGRRGDVPVCVVQPQYRGVMQRARLPAPCFSAGPGRCGQPCIPLTRRCPTPLEPLRAFPAPCPPCYCTASGAAPAALKTCRALCTHVP